jgi:hypothetical protein
VTTQVFFPLVIRGIVSPEIRRPRIMRWYCAVHSDRH